NHVSRSTAGAAPEDRAALIERGKVLREEIGVLEGDLRALEAELHDLLLRVPNIPDPSVPEGADESANVPVKYWGEPPRFAVPPRDHVALMERLDMLDVERGAKVAGSRSYMLKGAGALLEMALVQFAMDRLVAKGIMRVHQFTKVEQFVIGPADTAASLARLDGLLTNAEELLQALEIPYRVVLVCTGDMGDGKVKMYDIESWVPSENRYRETHSD